MSKIIYGGTVKGKGGAIYGPRGPIFSAVVGPGKASFLPRTFRGDRFWGRDQLSHDNSNSRTSHNGPSKRRTPALQLTLAVLRIENTIRTCKQPPRSGRFRIRTADKILAPNGAPLYCRLRFTSDGCVCVRECESTPIASDLKFG